MITLHFSVSKVNTGDPCPMTDLSDLDGADRGVLMASKFIALRHGFKRIAVPEMEGLGDRMGDVYSMSITAAAEDPLKSASRRRRRRRRRQDM